MSSISQAIRAAVAFCIGLALVSGLTGCGSHAGGTATQVVARVNDYEITVSELGQALNSTPAAEFGEHSTKAALAGLVDEQLLAQEARKAKVDRDPDVLLDMDRSRRQALVRAYLERAVFPQQPIPDAEKRKYYADNPVLFAKRRVFHVATFNMKEKVLSQALKDDQIGRAHV